MCNHLVRAVLVVLLACSSHALVGRAPGVSDPARPAVDTSPQNTPLSPTLRPVDDPSRPWPAFDRAASLEGEFDDDDRQPSGPSHACRFPGGFAARASLARITTRPVPSILLTRLRC